jgi:hypothetical protein
LEGYSKAKTGLLKLIKDHSKAKIDLSQLVNTVAVPKYISPVTLGIFIRPLYLFSNTNK